MSLILNGTTGLSDVDGTAAAPAIRGTDTNTGLFFGADIIGFAEGGVECARFNADSQFVAAAGTAALPVITTTGDVNTGIFFPAADTIAFAEGGAEVMRITSAGDVGIGTASPASKLDVSGTVTATTFSGAGTNLTGTANSLNAGIGVNQTWTSVSRAIGTTYTNSSGKPILVAITMTCSSGSTVQGLTINGVVVYAGSVGVAGTACGISLIVPNGATYVTVTNGGSLSLVTWYELR